MADSTIPESLIIYTLAKDWNCTPSEAEQVLLMMATEAVKRNMDPNVGGGVDRDTLKESDFAIPEEKKFPIVTPKDVADAARLIGRYQGKLSEDEVKARIIALAKRKGQAFIEQLPESWLKDDSEQSDEDSQPETKSGLDLALDRLGMVAEALDSLVLGKARVPDANYDAKAGDDIIPGRLKRGNDGTFSSGGSASTDKPEDKPEDKNKDPEGADKAKDKENQVSDEEKKRIEADRAKIQAADQKEADDKEQAKGKGKQPASGGKGKQPAGKGKGGSGHAGHAGQAPKLPDEDPREQARQLIGRIQTANEQRTHLADKKDEDKEKTKGITDLAELGDLIGSIKAGSRHSLRDENMLAVVSELSNQIIALVQELGVVVEQEEQAEQDAQDEEPDPGDQNEQDEPDTEEPMADTGKGILSYSIDELLKHNPYHDNRGRFSEAGGATYVNLSATPKQREASAETVDLHGPGGQDYFHNSGLTEKDHTEIRRLADKGPGRLGQDFERLDNKIQEHLHNGNHEQASKLEHQYKLTMAASGLQLNRKTGPQSSKRHTIQHTLELADHANTERRKRIADLQEQQRQYRERLQKKDATPDLLEELENMIKSEISLDQLTHLVRMALYKAMDDYQDSQNPDEKDDDCSFYGNDYSVERVYSTYAITCMQGKTYKVPYSIQDDQVQFPAVQFWQAVEVEYVPAKSLTETSKYVDIPVKAIGGPGTVKALDKNDVNRIGGYAILWGDQSKKDLSGEYFKPSTEELDVIFKSIGKLPYLYQHAMDGVLKTTPIGIVDTLIANDTGLWYEAQLDQSNKYNNAITKLIGQGRIGTSSGTLPGARKVAPDGFIERWAICEISATPGPMEYRMLQAPVSEIKAAYQTLGLPIPQELQAASGKGESDEDSRQDAEAERERLLIELEMLELDS